MAATPDALDAILAQGPPATRERKRTATEQAVAFCTGPVGVALISFVALFILLLALRPQWIYRRGHEHERGFDHISYGVVVAASTVGALLIGIVPFIVFKFTRNAPKPPA